MIECEMKLLLYDTQQSASSGSYTSERHNKDRTGKRHPGS
jgi:hypothetical protein